MYKHILTAYIIMVLKYKFYNNVFAVRSTFFLFSNNFSVIATSKYYIATFKKEIFKLLFFTSISDI